MSNRTIVLVLAGVVGASLSAGCGPRGAVDVNVGRPPSPSSNRPDAPLMSTGGTGGTGSSGPGAPDAASTGGSGGGGAGVDAPEEAPGADSGIATPDAPVASGQDAATPDMTPRPPDAALDANRPELDPMAGPILPALEGCPPAPMTGDCITDFEDGLTAMPRVGTRGGTSWSMMSLGEGASGTLTATAIPSRCGSLRAMRFAGTATAIRAPIARLLLMSGTRFFDASAYKGIGFAVRASAPMLVRLKVSDRNTTTEGGVCSNCSDHFAGWLEIGTSFRSFAVPFSALKQAGVGDQRPAVAPGGRSSRAGAPSWCSRWNPASFAPSTCATASVYAPATS